ncbi:hypothetical protein SB5439_05142 [Klebsiella variicola]|nr:hypothetical protein SB5439_05142 [Klebsiella variicola]
MSFTEACLLAVFTSIIAPIVVAVIRKYFKL